jgi:hypothetical protein
MSKLTEAELKWKIRVQKALNACPSDRIGFYTIGDHDIRLYDKSKNVDEENSENQEDFCTTVDRLDAGLGGLDFPSNVHSTAG